MKEEDRKHAMKQSQNQYRNKHYHLHQTYIQNKGRPNDIRPEDWNWLINNKWNDFKFNVSYIIYIFISKVWNLFFTYFYIIILNYFYIYREGVWKIKLAEVNKKSSQLVAQN